jgi:hypothetical protein
MPLVSAADIPASIPLWPNGAPGSEARKDEPEKMDGSNITNVHHPSVTPYLPEAGKATGTAVIVCPGGGHAKLCTGHEGYALCEWFRDHGIAAFLLKYRLSKEPGSAYTLKGHAMDDTRRSIRLVRSRAAEWGVKPERIGILGFSAGGELAAYAAMEPKADLSRKVRHLRADAGDVPSVHRLRLWGSPGHFRGHGDGLSQLQEGRRESGTAHLRKRGPRIRLPPRPRNAGSKVGGSLSGMVVGQRAPLIRRGRFAVGGLQLAA